VIQLHSDALWFQTGQGELIPCSAETIAFELVDASGKALDSELVRNAAKAVLHYFQEDLGRSQVTVGDFAQVFASVLRSFGLQVSAPEGTPAAGRVADADLCRLAADSGQGFELVFFAKLRGALRQSLAVSPEVVRFRGLRGCVKQLAGARRWNPQCQRLSDQIVAFLRDCLRSEPQTASCSLLVQ
jgi:hypothetical protein